MRLFSEDLREGEEVALIHAERGAGGRNIVPQLGWADVPEQAKSLAITIWDPDAPMDGGFWHWVAFDLSPMLQGTVGGSSLPDGSRELVNDYGYRGYGGPNPPQGQVHRYIFTLWALDADHLDIPDDATPPLAEQTFKDHTIATATLTPVFTSTL